MVELKHRSWCYKFAEDIAPWDGPIDGIVVELGWIPDALLKALATRDIKNGYM